MKISQLPNWREPNSSLDTSVSKRAKKIGEMELCHLSMSDVAFCLRQSITTEDVIPIALDMLSKQSLLEAEYYPGDLLNALIEAAKKGKLNSSQENDLWDICANALAEFSTIHQYVIPNVNTYLMEVNNE